MERYSLDEHFSRLVETTDVVRNYILRDKKINKYCSMFNHDPVWKKRILCKESRFLRPLIVRNVLEMLYGRRVNWIDCVDLMSSVELFNISTYQADKVFDLNLREVLLEIPFSEYKHFSVRQYIDSYITYNLALEQVEKSKIGLKKKEELINLMVLAMEKVYKGQFLDIFVLRDVFQEKPLDFEEMEFLLKYTERCIDLDGYQFAMCFRFGMIEDAFMSRENLTIVKLSLWEIGKYFGICLQILNDMADLSFGNKESFLEDVLNKKVTYPIYLLWNCSVKGREILEEVWEKGKFVNLDSYKRQISQILWENPLVVYKLLRLLKFFYLRISSNIRKLKSAGIEGIRFLDFIFPHIFCSRILKSYVKSSSDLNKMLMSIKEDQLEDLEVLSASDGR